MSKEELYINRSLVFAKGKLSIDGNTIFEQQDDENYVALTKRIFRSLDNSYPKFHKMDRISKLAFLSSELLLQDVSFKKYNPEDIAVIFSNSSATIETDKKFQASISEIPSPAIFVYTLPNIMVGEICIRHKIKGESLFFVEPQLNTELLTEQSELLFANSKTELCIIGWVDFYNPDDYNCAMSLVSRDNNGTILSEENLNSHFK